MAIVKNLKITVKKNVSIISEDVYLYLGDGGVTLLIEVLENHYKFGSFKSANTDLVEDSGAKWASVCILKANNEVVYGDRCEIYDGKIKFEITKDFIDEIAEMGTHLLQIHLFDGDDENSNRLTIPPVSLNILKPICDYNDPDPNTP